MPNLRENNAECRDFVHISRLCKTRLILQECNSQRNTDSVHHLGYQDALVDLGSFTRQARSQANSSTSIIEADFIGPSAK